MRLLADENFPRLLVRGLRERGHEVVWIRESAPGAPDEEVLRLARSDSRILATFDEGFRALASRQRLPATCGILLLRLSAPDPQALADIAIRAIEARSDWSGMFAVIEPDRIRIRPLPSSRP